MKSPRARARSLLSSIERSAENIALNRSVLLSVSAYKHPLVEMAARAYALEVKMFGLLCYEVLDLVRPNPPGEVPLELLERVFLSAKRVAVEAAWTAGVLEQKHSRAAKEARRTARQATKVARETARTLTAEMRRRGAWSDRIVKDIDLEEWL